MEKTYQITESVKQDFKELNLYLDHLCLQKTKDAGHSWIEFTDKFQAFQKRIISHLKEAPQPKQRAKYDVSTLGEKLNDIFDMAEYYLDDDLRSLQEVAGSCVIRKRDFESIKRSILHAAAELPASEEAPQLHLKELRERFFERFCTKDLAKPIVFAFTEGNEIFEWFVNNLQPPKEGDAEKLLIKIIQEEPSKACSWFNLQLGKEAVAAHAGEVTIKMDADIEGKRYKITTVTTVEEINQFIK